MTSTPAGTPTIPEWLHSLRRDNVEYLQLRYVDNVGAISEYVLHVPSVTDDAVVNGVRLSDGVSVLMPLPATASYNERVTQKTVSATCTLRRDSTVLPPQPVISAPSPMITVTSPTTDSSSHSAMQTTPSPQSATSMVNISSGAHDDSSTRTTVSPATSNSWNVEGRGYSDPTTTTHSPPHSTDNTVPIAITRQRSDNGHDDAVIHAESTAAVTSNSESSWLHPSALSHKGTSCHQCKNTKQLSALAFCNKLFAKRTKPEKRICRKKFCSLCLRKFYNLSMTECQAPGWICVSCQGLCTCAACTRTGSRKKKSDKRQFDNREHHNATPPSSSSSSISSSLPSTSDEGGGVMMHHIATGVPMAQPISNPMIMPIAAMNAPSDQNMNVMQQQVQVQVQAQLQQHFHQQLILQHQHQQSIQQQHQQQQQQYLHEHQQLVQSAIAHAQSVMNTNMPPQVMQQSPHTLSYPIYQYLPPSQSTLFTQPSQPFQLQPTTATVYAFSPPMTTQSLSTTQQQAAPLFVSASMMNPPLANATYLSPAQTSSLMQQPQSGVVSPRSYNSTSFTFPSTSYQGAVPIAMPVPLQVHQQPPLSTPPPFVPTALVDQILPTSTTSPSPSPSFTMRALSLGEGTAQSLSHSPGTSPFVRPRPLPSFSARKSSTPSLTRHLVHGRDWPYRSPSRQYSGSESDSPHSAQSTDISNATTSRSSSSRSISRELSTTMPAASVHDSPIVLHSREVTVADMPSLSFPTSKSADDDTVMTAAYPASSLVVDASIRVNSAFTAPHNRAHVALNNLKKLTDEQST